jgi:predicted nucleic acid-binding protein
MNIIDSSFWLEYLAGTEAGNTVSKVIENPDDFIVPSIILYEVFKKLLLETNEGNALFAIAHIKQGKIVDLDAGLALSAAKLSKEYKLPMADSIIYAATLKYNCILWTQDQHFSELPSVKYFN